MSNSSLERLIAVSERIKAICWQHSTARGLVKRSTRQPSFPPSPCLSYFLPPDRWSKLPENVLERCHQRIEQSLEMYRKLALDQYRSLLSSLFSTGDIGGPSDIHIQEKLCQIIEAAYERHIVAVKMRLCTISLRQKNDLSPYLVTNGSASFRPVRFNPTYPYLLLTM
jgi:hypothetical protein